MEVDKQSTPLSYTPVFYLRQGSRNMRLESCDYRAYLRESDISDFIKRPMTIKLYKQLFKQNPTLFNYICDIGDAVKQEVRESANPGLYEKIQRKQKLVEKHQNELEEMTTLYHWGSNDC